jgi:hypothetical protein
VVSALLVYYGHKRNNKVIIGMGLAIPIAIASFRYGVGTDYANYVTIYNNLSDLSLSQFLFDISSDIEIGFFALIKLSSFLTGDSMALFALSSFLTVGFFYLGLRRYNVKHPALVYLLFLLIIFPMTLNIVRQGVAMSIGFFALSFMIGRRPKAFVVWVGIASLFHTTALLLLPVYLLNVVITAHKNNPYLPFLLKLVVVSLSIYLVLPHMFEVIGSLEMFEKYDKYQVVVAEGNNYTLYLQFVILSLVVLLSKWTIPRDKMNVYFYFLTFAVFELLFTTLGFSSSFIKRIAFYFSFFNLILLTGFVDIFRDKLGMFVVYAAIVLYGIAYFYLAYYSMGLADVMPYQSLIGAK